MNSRGRSRRGDCPGEWRGGSWNETTLGRLGRLKWWVSRNCHTSSPGLWRLGPWMDE